MSDIRLVFLNIVTCLGCSPSHMIAFWKKKKNTNFCKLVCIYSSFPFFFITMTSYIFVPDIIFFKHILYAPYLLFTQFFYNKVLKYDLMKFIMIPVPLSITTEPVMAYWKKNCACIKLSHNENKIIKHIARNYQWALTDKLSVCLGNMQHLLLTERMEKGKLGIGTEILRYSKEMVIKNWHQQHHWKEEL